jgi:hypothetical protein
MDLPLGISQGSILFLIIRIPAINAQTVYLFLEDFHKTTPPIPITAIPISGDQSR